MFESENVPPTLNHDFERSSMELYSATSRNHFLSKSKKRPVSKPIRFTSQDPFEFSIVNDSVIGTEFDFEDVPSSPIPKRHCNETQDVLENCLQTGLLAATNGVSGIHLHFHSDRLGFSQNFTNRTLRVLMETTEIANSQRSSFEHTTSRTPQRKIFEKSMESIHLLTPDIFPDGSRSFDFSPNGIKIVELNDELALLSRKIMNLRTHPERGATFNVIVTHFDFCNSIWIWPVSRRKSDFAQTMDFYTEILGKVAAEISPFSVPPAQNELVIAPFEGGFFRATVCSVSQDGNCEVLFVDYGNRAIVHFEELHPADLAALKEDVFPAVAVRCKLAGLDYGFVPSDPASFETNLRKTLFLHDLEDGTLIGKVFENSANPDILEINLTDRWNKDLVADILKLGISAPKLILSTRHGSDLLPLGLLKVKIRFLESFNVLYIWPDNVEITRQKIKAMSSRQAKKFGRSFTQPAPGCFVSVRHKKDGLFYRAVVRSINSAFSTASVQFLDFGNEGVVKFEDLFPLDEENLRIFAQALKCFVSWTTKDWMDPVFPTGNLDDLALTLTGRGSATVQIKVMEFWKSGEADPNNSEEIFSEDFSVIQIQIPDGFPYKLTKNANNSLLELSTDTSSFMSTYRHESRDQTIDGTYRESMDH